MDPKLKHGESGTRGARRITRRRIKSALHTLGPEKTSDHSIHSARKELKKARAMLRLLRDALGKTTYKRENTALRDAARPLSEVRDGRVLLDALNSLTRYYGAPASALPLAGFKRALGRRRMRSRESVLGSHEPLRDARKALRAVSSRSARWHVGRHGWSVLGAGLKRTYTRGRDAFRQARATPTNENLHEWRKQTKYFGYQLQLLEPLGSARVRELTQVADKLADFLGDDHDLAVLYDRAGEARASFPRAATHNSLLALIKRCRASLQQKAAELGLRLYEERPAVFSARMEKSWRDWREG
jgi:CHAD domain-containing protein